MPAIAREVAPSGPNWLHEIKHDGFRILASRDAARVRLFTRDGHDLTALFPLIRTGMLNWPVSICLICLHGPR